VCTNDPTNVRIERRLGSNKFHNSWCTFRGQSLKEQSSSRSQGLVGPNNKPQQSTLSVCRKVGTRIAVVVLVPLRMYRVVPMSGHETHVLKCSFHNNDYRGIPSHFDMFKNPRDCHPFFSLQDRSRRKRKTKMIRLNFIPIDLQLDTLEEEELPKTGLGLVPRSRLRRYPNLYYPLSGVVVVSFDIHSNHSVTEEVIEDALDDSLGPNPRLDIFVVSSFFLFPFSINAHLQICLSNQSQT
jgi:hypothetical protein